MICDVFNDFRRNYFTYACEAKNIDENNIIKNNFL